MQIHVIKRNLFGKLLVLSI